MSQSQLVQINRYAFSEEYLTEIRSNAYAANNWPLVYILSDDKVRKAYVGETTDAITRLNTHLKNPEKKSLVTVHLVSSDRFNKSATLDIESSLIKYMSADNCFNLINGNLGLVDHNYYQKDDLYADIFLETWDKLRSQGIVKKSIESIDNSDVFKYSPYKSLSFDQQKGLIEILRALVDPSLKNVMVEGSAGTGKSVLAIFLFKLIHSDMDQLNLENFSDTELELRDLVLQVKQLWPNPSMALVVPMGSFRNTLKKAFRNVAGLNSKMVISPSELTKQRYDIVLVDESHRLRKRVNLGAYYGAFDRSCAALGLDKETSSEVDWVTLQSDKSIFFYDPNQTIKPSDANATDFENIKSSPNSCRIIKLISQFRVRAGLDYVKFINDLLRVELPPDQKFKSDKYEFMIFDNLADMVGEINQRNKSYGLARLVAGYSWPWVSKTNSDLYDIVIDDVSLRWNSTNIDWINTEGAQFEVGCIHTTQGYDLNYTGVIFGHEISYDEHLDKIVIDKENYHDRTGKQTVEDPDELKRYILNIYRTIMLRGIRGTFIYACDAGLRRYLKKHIATYKSNLIKLPVSTVALEPYVNSVPLYDLRAAAGSFSDLQQVEYEKWIAVPDDVYIRKDMFACHVVGESMNKIIPSGSICLFRFNPGGSRNGKIVLVECADLQDGDAGSRYTIKEYQSFKVFNDDGVENSRIVLKPRSTDTSITTIEINSTDDEHRYKVVGEFLRVIA